MREWLRDERKALLVPPENPRDMAIAIARCLGITIWFARSGCGEANFHEHFQLDSFWRAFAVVAGRNDRDGRTKGTPEIIQRWVELYETLGPVGPDGISPRLDSLGKQPLISVLLPVYNPELDLLLRRSIP